VQLGRIVAKPPAAADLVVTDPLQAGVMTVMAVAETAKFSLARLKRRAF
jgi:energy-converting hydrogenase B subunit Q